MIRLGVSTKKGILCLAAALVSIVLVGAWLPDQAAAGDLTNRRVVVGTSRPSAITTHTFDLVLATAGTLGSIEFEYCVNSPFVGQPCTAPAGLSASAAVLTSQLGATGFSIHASSTVNRLVLTRAPSATGAVTLQYVFGTVTNPSQTLQTVFVRLSTYASDDATGSRIDTGSVAFSTSGLFSTTGFVPPYLIFCVGVTVAADCSATSGNYINLGVLRSNQANTGTSQMSTFTNDVTGYVLTIAGTTMTSGTNVIPALPVPTFSAPGNSQFGINLRDNSSPEVGLDPIGVGTGVPAADYSGPNNFKFNNGDIVATSPLPTEPNILTVSYLVNVSSNQSPGVYVTTLTYIATVQF